MDIRFVNRNEPEGEDLVDFDEEDLSFLVEFCEVLARVEKRLEDLIPSHSTFSTIFGESILYHRYTIHITHRELISPINGREYFEKLGTLQRGCVKLACGRK
jgi:hypothetical protein